MQNVMSLNTNQQRLITDYMHRKGDSTIRILISKALKRKPSTDVMDELVSEAHLALVKAAKTYDPQKASFDTHVRVVVTSWIKSWVRNELRDCRKIYYSTQSLDSLDDNGVSYLDKVASDFNIDDSIPDKVSEYLNTLSDDEKAILKLKVAGYSWTEAGEYMGCSKKRTSDMVKQIQAYERVKILWRR